MTTTLTARRAFTRLTTCRAVAPLRVGQPFRVPLPEPVDSRTLRPTLSTGARLAWARALDLVGLVAAAVGVVALLALLCR